MSFDVLLSPPDVGDSERAAVLAALDSGWVAPAGPDLDAFESEMASYVGVPHAVGVSSGTAALHLALVSWGVGPGDVVPVSTLTFAATVNAIRYVGATPYFVDCDESGNISPILLDKAVGSLRAEGATVPVVVPVDLLGKVVDHAAIAGLAEEHGFRVLADAAESLGASRGNRASAAWGDAAVLSFNGNKIITTSGGGMLVTHDPELATHVKKLSTQAREPVAHYEHQEVGYNYRLSNLLAAIGRAQLQRLPEILRTLYMWRDRYRAAVAEAPGVEVLGGDDDTEDNCWLSALIIDPEVAGFTRDGLGQAMTDAGIESRPLWKPMHLQPVSQGLPGLIDGTSERLFDRGITLPSGSGMSEQQFVRVLDVLGEAVAR